MDLERIIATFDAVREAVRSGAAVSAHDIAEGGIAVALAESCLAGGIGARVELGSSGSPEEALFGEAPGGFLLSGSEEQLRSIGERVALQIIGTVGGESLAIELEGAEHRARPGRACRRARRGLEEVLRMTAL